MKFLSLALVAFIAEAASAAKSLSSNELNAMLRSGSIDKRLLLKHAIPYQRKLQQGDQDANEAQGNADANSQNEASAQQQQSADYYTMFGALGKNGITGDYSVSFNSCVSFTVEEDWELLANYENMASYIQSEQIQSVRNYVLFNVCETVGDCKTPEISEKNTYMVDLDTWVTAMLNYLPDQKDAYCEGCWNQQEFCEQVYRNGWDRTMNIDYSTAFFFYDDMKFQLIDCDQCQTYGCYDEGGDTYTINGWDQVDAWISKLAQCQATETQFMGADLYAGFMCNQAGNGLEIGMFMDDACTLYNSQKSYGSTLGDGDEDWVNYGKSQRVINYLFNYMFDCYGGDLIYVNLYQQVFLDNNGWQYDPCQIDSSTGEYFDREACEEVVNTNPCYVTSDANGNQNEINQDDCAMFMEVYPCWTMPGGSVSDEYKEACDEYQAAYSHATNYACSLLFGSQNQNQNGQQQNHNQNGQQQNQQQNSAVPSFAATALSACSYSYKSGSSQVDGQENQEGYYSGNWTLNLHYDIRYNMTNDPTAICNYMDFLFLDDNHLDTQVYDTDTSGQLFNYEDLGEEADATYFLESSNETATSASSSEGTSTTNTGSSYGTVYFPTTNTMPSSLKKVVKESRRMSSGAIAATAVGTALGAFVLFVTVRQISKRYSRKERHPTFETDQKDIPLIA